MILSYLGSKASILPVLDQVISPLITTKHTRFCDLFLGSGCVSNYFKNKVQFITGCDTELYSYVLSSALLKCPYSHKLGRIIDTLNELCLCSLPSGGLICKNFSQSHLFFSAQNACRIDFIRKSIGVLYMSGVINYNEFLFILASLLKTSSKYANTTGTFRAHLKQLGKKALRPLILEPIHKDLSICLHTTLKMQDAFFFVKKMKKVDIVYIDPPYNSVHYSAYYSFLNYLCLYNRHVKLVGTGIIKDYYKSNFGIIKTAFREVKNLLDILQSKTKYIIMSYNSNGAIPIRCLCDLMKKYGNIKVNRFPHKKYQSNKSATIKRNSNFEYIITLSLFC